LLSNISILDFADKGGAFCSKVLADLGARVAKFVAQDATPSKISSCRFEELLFSYHNSNKFIVASDPGTLEGTQEFRELLKSADVLIESLSAGHLRSLELIPESPECFNPRLVWILLPEQASYPEAIYGAIAAVLNLRKREITGIGCRIDLSKRSATPDLWIDDRRDRQFQILPCADGFFLLTIFRNLETIFELMNAEQIAIDQGSENSIDLITNCVTEWMRRHSRKELFELGQAMRFPWAPVESPEEVLRSAQLRARGFFIPVVPKEGSPAIQFPGKPYRLFSDSQFQTENIGEKNRGRPMKHAEILSGLRVIDLTRMISGPYTTRILADSGAEVIKIQSRDTAQGAERNDTDQFAIWNRNKRSLCLDLNRHEAKELFIRLVKTSDVVVENFSPRVMSNWGLDYARLQQVKSGLIMASISAMGQTGPWRDFVGFAPTFHALSGLIFSNSPEDLLIPYADMVTALYSSLAILAAVAHRDRTGTGQYMDVSGYEATCTMNGPALIAAAAGIPANEYRQDFDRNLLLHREEKPEKWKSSPSLGRDNHYVAVELLGYSESEYESLTAKGILG
jgi:crotonobetainyl-CoA:carnitine CoA-transferase CaiB-like acyl-CoA transferase